MTSPLNYHRVLFLPVGRAGAGGLVGDRALQSYWGADSSQHVYFVGVDGDLHQLYIQPGTGWVDNNLTQLAVMAQSS